MNTKLQICLLALPLMAIAFVPGAAAQEAIGVSPAGDQVATVTVVPPSAIEDNSIVEQRMRANPIQEVTALPTLHKDNATEPEVFRATVDFSLPDDGSGLRGLEQGWNCGSSGAGFPPDPTMACGPSHLIVANNVYFRIYTKTGTQNLESSWAVFFSSVKPSGTFTSDPKVIYDPDSGRWFIMILAIRSSDYHSWYLVGVSDDSNPNGTWMKYAFDSTLNGGTSTNYWSDYPGLGASADAIYITANMFSQSTFAFRYVKVRVFPKQQLLDFETTITWSDIWSITDPGGGNAFAIQPALHYGGTPEAPFLVDTNPSSKVSIFGVNDPLGTPSLSKVAITVTSYSSPPNAEQPGGNPTLDTIDTRVFNAVWRNSKLYFAHNRSRNNNAAAKWYIVNTASWPSTATLVAEGTINDSTVNQWFPTVAVNANDTLAVGFCRSSSSEYASMFYAYRTVFGTMSDPLPIKQGTAHYTGEGGTNVRWGDYTGTVIDPEDDLSFWHYNEFPHPTSSTQWRTHVHRFTTNDCVPPEITQQPAASQTVCQGSTAMLSISVSTPGVSYQWRIGNTDLADDGVHIFGATTSTLSIANVTPADEAPDYNCVVSDPNDCTVTSNDSELLVDTDVANILTQPQDVTVTEGDPAVFSIQVENDILYNYQWRMNGTDLTEGGRFSGTQSTSLVIIPAELGDDGAQFDCVITYQLGAQCAITSDAATLTVTASGNDCPEDLDGDGTIGLGDLSILLANYGQTGMSAEDGDLDGDGEIGLSDLSILLAVYGQDCPTH